MYKVRLFGEIDATSTCVNFHDAAALLMPAVGNAHTSGDIVSLETGEVLVLLQDGNVTHISPETLTKMLDAIFEVDPELAFGLALFSLMAFSAEEAPAEPEEDESEEEPSAESEEDEFLNLLEILGIL